MSDIDLMQKLLDETLIRIDELEKKIKVSDGTLLHDLRKQHTIQTRIKITLIRSIQELRPSDTTVTIFKPLKKSLFSKFKTFFGIQAN